MAKYNFWSFCQDFVAVSMAPSTGGASLLISPTARKMVGIGGSDDSSNQTTETWKIQNDQWKELIASQRAELEQLRKDRDSKEGKIKNNSDEITRLTSIANDPTRTKEERDNAKKRIVLLETDNKQLKKDIANLEKGFAEKSQIPPQSSKPWIFPKLSLVDKTLIAGGTILLVYMLIPSKKRD